MIRHTLRPLIAAVSLSLLAAGSASADPRYYNHGNYPHPPVNTYQRTSSNNDAAGIIIGGLILGATLGAIANSNNSNSNNYNSGYSNGYVSPPPVYVQPNHGYSTYTYSAPSYNSYDRRYGNSYSTSQTYVYPGNGNTVIYTTRTVPGYAPPPPPAYPHHHPRGYYDAYGHYHRY